MNGAIVKLGETWVSVDAIIAIERSWGTLTSSRIHLCSGSTVTVPLSTASVMDRIVDLLAADDEVDE